MKRELLRGNWSLFTVSRRRQTATYTHGCEDWRREDEEEQRERGEREVVRRVQLRGKTMNAVDSKRDGPYERPTRFSANERPSKESFIRQTSIASLSTATGTTKLSPDVVGMATAAAACGLSLCGFWTFSSRNCSYTSIINSVSFSISSSSV